MIDDRISREKKTKKRKNIWNKIKQMKEEEKNCFMLGRMNEGRREQIIWTDVERRDFMMKTRKMNVNTMNKTFVHSMKWS